MRKLALRLLLLLVALTGAGLAQTPPSAVVLDAAGPWRNASWSLGVTAFTSLLADAGSQLNTVSPVDLPSAGVTPGVLLAVPSLESLPLTTFKAVTAFVAA